MSLPSLSEIDICITDFDGCMVRGISKVSVAIHIGTQIIFAPHQFKDRVLLPRLGFASVMLVTSRLLQKLSGGLSDADLVRTYAKYLHGVPASYFQQASQLIPKTLNPGVEQTFSWLGRQWPVVVISLAMDIVLDEIDSYLTNKTGFGFSLKYGNSLTDLNGGNESGAVLTAEDKLYHAKQALERLNRSCPLVIGHDREDLAIAQFARENGGVSLGLNPKSSIANQFDLVTYSSDWRSIPKLLESALR